MREIPKCLKIGVLLSYDKFIQWKIRHPSTWCLLRLINATGKILWYNAKLKRETEIERMIELVCNNPFFKMYIQNFMVS